MLGPRQQYDSNAKHNSGHDLSPQFPGRKKTPQFKYH